MTKEVRKAFMKRSQLKNRYNKNHNYENRYLYKKQRNFCVSLLRKTKRNYFKNHIAPPIVSSLFEIRENTHNTRYFQGLSNESRRTVNYALETICYRAPFLWANLPPEYKLTNSLNIFKRKIKTGKEKIVHVGYAKRTLENWATFSFPRCLSISLTFFFKNTIKK